MKPSPVLTERERLVCRLLAEGCSCPQIARGLSRSVATVRVHVRTIHRKLGVTNRAQLIRAYRLLRYEE